jgi:hypothetical protein
MPEEKTSNVKYTEKKNVKGKKGEKKISKEIMSNDENIQ